MLKKLRFLKQLDAFKTGKSFNISRKKKDVELHEHRHYRVLEDNQEKLGSKIGGVFTILLVIALCVYFEYLLNRMYSGMDDN